jgi:hypothetical protein
MLRAYSAEDLTQGYAFTSLTMADRLVSIPSSPLQRDEHNAQPPKRIICYGKMTSFIAWLLGNTFNWKRDLTNPLVLITFPLSIL